MKIGLLITVREKFGRSLHGWFFGVSEMNTPKHSWLK